MVLIRSTVPVGTVDRVQALHPDLTVAFMPEFLTEDHWKEDVDSCTLWPMGFSAGSKETELAGSFTLQADLQGAAARRGPQGTPSRQYDSDLEQQPRSRVAQARSQLHAGCTIRYARVLTG